MRLTPVIPVSLFLLGPIAPAHALPLAIATDKRVYLPYEPVYLQMTLEEAIPDSLHFYFGKLELDGMAQLRITGPDQRTHEYTPPAVYDQEVRTKEKVFFSTLLLDRPGILTERPGRYALQLFTRDGKAVSASLDFEVAPPATDADRRAVELIQTDPGAYGTVVYLEGGDHLPNGIRILQALSDGPSSYARLANTILAMNYSQPAYALGNDRARRPQDPARVGRYLEKGVVDSNPYLEIKLAYTILSQSGAGKDVPPDVKAKLRDIRDRYGNHPSSLARIMRELD